jgi:tripartite-type tricarboxylate transporter receptor subunit TctC
LRLEQDAFDRVGSRSAWRHIVLQLRATRAWADVIANMTAGGFEPGTKPMAEVEAFIKAERVRWGEVIRAAGTKPE